MDASRTPVIVGVGQVNDREPDPFAALSSVGLMAAALREADRDAGGGWLARADWLAVVDQLSFPELNPVKDTLLDTLGIRPKIVTQTPAPMGDSPVRLLNEAANRVAAGELDIVAVVGGEALRTAARRAAAAGDTPGDHNAMRGRHGVRAPGGRARYGLVAPVDVYPLYENATRAAWGQSLDEAQAESGAIWAAMADVAAANPHAWLRTPRSADEIVTPSPANRPLAFPYTKLQVANSAVNQGAAFIVTSLAAARARGLRDPVFVGAGAAAREPDDVLARGGFADSPAMRVSLEGALAANGLKVGAFDAIELYSCFPCIPKMARRVLGLGTARPLTVAGGLTFAGGPIGNYMSHAIAAAVERMRAGTDRALLFGNGGFATYNHTIVLTREPGIALPLPFDRQADADARREPVPPLDEGYAGPATVETYTVLYGRDGAPHAGVVVARSPTGARLLARVPGSDAAAIAFLTDGRAEPVGSRGTARPDADGLTRWQVD